MNLTDIKKDYLRNYATKHANDILADGRTIQQWVEQYPLNFSVQWKELIEVKQQKIESTNLVRLHHILKTLIPDNFQLDKIYNKLTSLLFMVNALNRGYISGVVEYKFNRDNITLALLKNSYIDVATKYPYIEYKLRYDLSDEVWAIMLGIVYSREEALYTPRILFTEEELVKHDCVFGTIDYYVMFLFSLTAKTKEDFLSFRQYIIELS